MKIIKNFSNTDKKLLAACAIATLICILLLSPLGDYFLQSSNVASRSGKVLGKISFQKNDVRHRYKSEMTWLQAKDEQNISVGDSVFAGPDSTARVDLENSNNVTVSENSLVVFEEIDKVRFANLQTGNFRLKVNGKLKIAIQGDLREISGTDAEIQIFTDKNNKPKLRLLKGSASIRKANKPPINLINGEIASLNHVEHKIPIGEDKQKQEAPILQKPQQLVKYIWRLYDHFERLEDQLAPKKDLPKKVLLQTKISWLLTQRQQTFFELSSLSDFQESIKATTSTHFIDLNEVFIGENFIRVSQDQLNWGKTEKFIVETKFLENVEPFAKISASDFPLISDSVKVPISLQTAAENPIGLVGQYSGDELFPPDKTETFWWEPNQKTIQIETPGRHHYRFKTVAQNLELSDWSPTIKLNVFIPQAPNAPSLLSGDLEGFVDDEFNLAWDSEGLNTRIEIKDSSGHKVNSFSDKNVIWRPKLIGKYTARAWTVDKYGRTSPPSKPIGILVKAQPPKQEAQKKPEEPVRKPTSIVAALTSKIEAVALRIFNEKYKSSQLSINGFLWGMFSSEQTAAGEANPIASGIGFKGYIWKGNHGVEVLAKSGVLGVNDIGEEQSSLKDIEARYHYRFFTGFPFGISRELQVTFFGGYEAYRNAGGSFSSEYDLVKLGTSLQFPFSSHWMSGGEFVYGLGPGGNWKGEVSGNLSYFMNFNWSFGVGYRIHLFNAGTAEASPKGRIPYREGYTEGYSVMNYHF